MISDTQDTRVFLSHVPLVFVTKYRRNVFAREILEDLYGVYDRVCTDFGAGLIEIDGEHDLVHILVNYPPKVSVSVLVNNLKGVSIRLVRKICTGHLEKIVGTRALVARLFLRQLRWSVS